MQSTASTILVGILDWGLGHATRCVPIIRELQKQEGIRVILAAENRAKSFLHIEFPDIKIIEFPNYNIKYPRNKSMAWKMVVQSRKIVRTINKEHEYLKKVIEEENISAIISDNRYGIWSKNIPSIIITHQLNIQPPWYLKSSKAILNSLLKKHLSNFKEIWIPDIEDDPSLAGHLTLNPSLGNKKFIGPLSRFDAAQKNEDIKYDVAVVLSGPEPQRSILEKILIRQLQNTKFNVAFVKGKTEERIQTKESNISYFSHLSSIHLEKLMRESKIIIARSGYSTIMDLMTIGKDALLIPTPGQTEQEYLAKYYKDRGVFYSTLQNKINIVKDLEEATKYTNKKAIFAPELIKKEIENLLDSIKQ